MAGGHHKQHQLEFGGSPVDVEPPGTLQFRLVDRIPVIAVSHTFNETRARQIRYELVATVGPERPFYHRYYHVVLDVRMIDHWEAGAAEFVAALRKRMNDIGGELFVVNTVDIPVPASVPRFTTVEDALAAAKDLRARQRAERLRA